MPSPRSDTRQNQHYVPQLLLRNFASNMPARRGKEKIWALDKKTGRVFNSNIRGVAAQSNYYEASFGETRFSLEDGLCSLEDATAPVLQKILRERSLAGLTVDERTWMSIFVAAQFLRTEGHREQLIEISELIDNFVRSEGSNPEELSGWSCIDKETAKPYSLEFIVNHLSHFTGHFANKIWMIHEAPLKETFYIGDNPVVMHNDEAHGPRGDLGLDVKGIQIYLPIGPRTCLAMYHPSVMARAKLDLMRAQEREAARAVQIITQLIATAESGSPLTYTSDNVTFVNSLQVHYASRFVMSKFKHFELAEEIIRTKPNKSRRWSVT